MIEVFVKHSPTCSHRADKLWKRCNCRKWLYNPEWKPDPRRSAKTRSWERAIKEARRLEATDGDAEKVTMQKAISQFLTDKRNQNVSKPWYRKFEKLLGGWIPEREIDSVTLRDLEAFRDSWRGAPITKRKKQERLRSFFHYCVKHRWLHYNPAVDLSKIKVEDKPTMPLDREHFERIVTQTDGDFQALIYLMRYSGLRISDAVSMPKDKLADSTVFLRTQKTKTVVRVPIPKDVAEIISEHLPLYKGGRTLKSCVTDFQERFQKLGIHSHQLRDTFAVELLLAGVPIEDVSQLLGHSDIKVTQKSYSPWVKARQDKLEAAVRKSWK
jgi:integrase/recombinase XerD